MKKKLRGVKRSDIQLDYDLYRAKVPMRGVSDAFLSVLDLHPEGTEKTIMFVHGYAVILRVIIGWWRPICADMGRATRPIPSTLWRKWYLICKPS